MKSQCKLSTIALALCFAFVSLPFAANATKYDMVTSTKAMVARDSLEALDLSVVADPNGANIEMYSPDKMNSIIENNNLEAIVKNLDKCQFTSDIEDRARLVKSPVFMYAWGQMLTSGMCVRLDKELGLGYIRMAADEGYAPAMMMMATYYERGIGVSKNMNVSEQYMHTAAALGSKTARLNWADMLIRGYGSPSLYEEAFGWLYHSDFDDDYSKAKKAYLETQLKKHLPPNVIARNEAFEPDY